MHIRLSEQTCFASNAHHHESLSTKASLKACVSGLPDDFPNDYPSEEPQGIGSDNYFSELDRLWQILEHNRVWHVTKLKRKRSATLPLHQLLEEVFTRVLFFSLPLDHASSFSITIRNLVLSAITGTQWSMRLHSSSRTYPSVIVRVSWSDSWRSLSKYHRKYAMLYLNTGSGHCKSCGSAGGLVVVLRVGEAFLQGTHPWTLNAVYLKSATGGI